MTPAPIPTPPAEAAAQAKENMMNESPLKYAYYIARPSGAFLKIETFCGAKQSKYAWYLNSLEHAQQTMLADPQLRVCLNCLDAAHKAGGPPMIPPTPNPAAEALARAVHASWRDGMLNQGREVAESRMDWNTLSTQDKALDAYIAEKVLAAASLTTPAPAEAVAELDIETISAGVHDEWMAEQRRRGRTSSIGRDGEEYMVPYAQLTEAAKELDRVTVRAVLKHVPDMSQNPEKSDMSPEHVASLDISQPQPAPDYEKEGMMHAVNRGAPTHAFYNVPQVDGAREAWLKGFNFVKAELDFQFQRGLQADRNPLDLGFTPKVSAPQPAPDALREALEWYAAQVGRCRKVTSEGQEARRQLDRDRGAKARTALAQAEAR